MTNATDELDPFDVDLEEDDLSDDADDREPEESPVAERGEPGAEPLEEPAPVQRARRALRAAQAEGVTAVSRLRLAEERVVNANGSVKLAAAKAVDLEEEKAKPYQIRAANEAVERYKRARSRLELELEERRKEVEAAEKAVRAAEEFVATAVANAADEEARAAAEAAAAATGQDSEKAPELYFANVDEFVREFLRYVYRRPIDGRSLFWSPEWWRYDEALNRLEAMWRAWEHLRLDPATGNSVWWRDHADPHMRVLMSPHGPFRRQVDVTTDDVDPLPYTAPPEGLFRDERAAGADPTPPRVGDDHREERP